MQNHRHNKGRSQKPKSEYCGVLGAILCNVLIKKPTLLVSPAARWKHLERRSADKKEDEISICLFPPLSSPSLSAIIQWFLVSLFLRNLCRSAAGKVGR